MVDACRVRAECRAARVVVTAPVVRGARCHSTGAEATATDPAAREQHASSMHPSVQRDGRTATGSSSHAHLEQVNAQGALLMAYELLLYCPADACYDARLGRSTETVTNTGPPPPMHVDQAEPLRDTCLGNPPHGPPPQAQEEEYRCEIVHREALINARAVLEQ
ncbi:hypothetical protein D1007_61836 [Hordeum vulgare]|nr:hypothetical protein D1007_61836 [Hordeum vulgare]